jgi:hypothetical protein
VNIEVVAEIVPRSTGRIGMSASTVICFAAVPGSGRAFTVADELWAKVGDGMKG